MAVALVMRRAGSGSYVQLTAPVTSYQFGLLIPELGSTEIFEPICQGIMQSPQAKSHSLIWGHTSHKSSSKEEAALALCRQFIEQKVSGVFFAPLEFVDEKDSINHQLVAELRQAAAQNGKLEPFLEKWEQETRQTFVTAYDEVAHTNGLYESLQAMRPLLQLFEIEKALYEVRYELGNRPDWAGIPLRSLIAFAE